MGKQEHITRYFTFREKNRKTSFEFSKGGVIGKAKTWPFVSCDELVPSFTSQQGEQEEHAIGHTYTPEGSDSVLESRPLGRRLSVRGALVSSFSSPARHPAASFTLRALWPMWCHHLLLSQLCPTSPLLVPLHRALSIPFSCAVLLPAPKTSSCP